MRCQDGVRYAVPSAIRPEALTPEDTLTLRFRVGGVYKNKRIVVTAGKQVIFTRKRPVLAPGEMETVQLKAQLILDAPEAEEITVRLEDA